MVNPVYQINTTVEAMRTKIRRLTASPSSASLSTQAIDEALNTFYNQDFPYAIKTDQMRSVYAFFTRPYIDRYPLDINFNQSVRAPVYVEGYEGNLFKDRSQFYNMWPRYPTQFQPISGDGITTAFTFTLPGPFLSHEVVLGGVDVNGTAISVNDDGNGNLQLQVPNPVVSVPAQPNVYVQTVPPTIPANLVGSPIPGMKNVNTLDPGLYRVNTQTTPFTNAIGSVNYVTGAFSINFPVAPASGTLITAWVSQYQTGRPYSLLFWNNEFIIRPVPKIIYKVEVETYLTPVQFMLSTDNPIVAQWWQYLAYGASMEILRERQDFDGVEGLREGFQRQEALVLERQGCEEIFNRNSTIYTSSSNPYPFNNGWNQAF